MSQINADMQSGIKFTESCRSWEAEAENPDFKASIGYLARLKVT